jgi:hypothetical protein
MNSALIAPLITTGVAIVGIPWAMVRAREAGNTVAFRQLGLMWVGALAFGALLLGTLIN